MRWLGRVQALCVAAAVVTLSGLPAAGQADADRDDSWDTDPPANTTNRATTGLLNATAAPRIDILSGGIPGRLMYFAGVDLWRSNLTGYVGLQWNPSRPDRDGFILRLMGSGGLERLHADGVRYQTQIFRAAVMPGYVFKRGNLHVQVLAGPDLEIDVLSVDRRRTWTRAAFGARFTTDLWWEPTPLIMAQASFSATTIDAGISARAATGWRMMNRFWIGPEVLASVDRFSRQYRIGAHLTGFRTGVFEWSIAAGYVADSFNRTGAYARIGMLMRPDRPLFAEN